MTQFHSLIDTFHCFVSTQRMWNVFIWNHQQQIQSCCSGTSYYSFHVVKKRSTADRSVFQGGDWRAGMTAASRNCMNNQRTGRLMLTSDIIFKAIVLVSIIICSCLLDFSHVFLLHHACFVYFYVIFMWIVRTNIPEQVLLL